MVVIALGGFVCTQVATKGELMVLKQDVDELREDVRLILQHLLNERVASDKP